MNVALHPRRGGGALNILSLCTGGGGLDLGVELAVPAARTVCMVEREAFAVAQLVSAMEAGLVAPAPVWSDARTFDGRPWRGVVDMLIGGIPCQPHSLAGRKRGAHDERDLWSDARRIIVRARPWAVLIENVAGMLSAGSDEIAGAERVWRDLRKMGFAVEAGLFTAAEVGASHERERLFIFGVADAGGEGLQGVQRGRPPAKWHWAEAFGPASEFRCASLVHPECSEWWKDPVRRHESDRDDSGRDQAAGGAGEPGADLDGTIRRRWAARRHDNGCDVGHESCATGEYDLVDPARERWREGRAEPELRGGRDAAAGTGSAVADATVPRGGAASVQPGRQDEAGGDAHGAGLFPPGPGDLSRWRDTLERAPELEPAIRGVADGLASRLDIARVDRLRLLGNGVVPLAAAYAVRTLAARLAARGAAGAARFVRLMESAE